MTRLEDPVSVLQSGPVSTRQVPMTHPDDAEDMSVDVEGSGVYSRRQCWVETLC